MRKRDSASESAWADQATVVTMAMSHHHTILLMTTLIIKSMGHLLLALTATILTTRMRARPTGIGVRIIFMTGSS